MWSHKLKSMQSCVLLHMYLQWSASTAGRCPDCTPVRPLPALPEGAPRCVQPEGGTEEFVLQPDSQLPQEGELRRLATPDAWCGWESMAAAELRLQEAGLERHADLAELPLERLRLCAAQLPPGQVGVAVCCAAAMVPMLADVPPAHLRSHQAVDLHAFLCDLQARLDTR